ncbi:Tellurite resistance protein TehA [Ferrithrix thermotolerans DSM 19514]|uniref:Tellurite resistance protein TehA n=1 Tax=Ferrithrix thermotolerans DSM 19514 TaxID=1121881 RepID=A0A1M4TH80_9ACTN|nr:hypothetical protein [Ferrithrix thermotolerans]SHE43796.1 Tellurite resistance protein TehA [Ferrithrix thermotolerans DSM 19514]
MTRKNIETLGLSRSKPSKDLPKHQPIRFGFDYFTFVMGSGIVAVLAPRLSSALRSPAKVLWVVTALTLVVLTATALCKYLLRPKRFLAEMRDETRSHFFGAVPMALASVTNGVFLFYPHLFGSTTANVLFYVVLVDCTLSLFSAVSVTFHLFVHHDVGLPNVTASWLLSIVPAEVAAASASFLIPHLPIHQGTQLLWIGYLMWGVSVPLALSVLVILFLRLALHKLPPSNLATNSWLTLGPLGTGAAGILTLGADSGHLLTGSLHGLGTPLLALGVIGAFTLFGYGIWWWITSMGVSLKYLLSGDYPFNFGWCAFTFPLGVFTTAAFAIAQETKIPGGLAFARGLTLLLVTLWVVVFVKTLWTLFHQGRNTMKTSPISLHSSQDNFAGSILERLEA